MAEIVLEIFGRVAIEAVALAVGGAIRLALDGSRSNRSTSSSKKQNRSISVSSQKQNPELPALSSSSTTQHRRAVLTASSSISFGNDCERLVNIAFQTSQTFPKMMGKYDDVSEYLRKELAKQYPGEYFHIIIGQNEQFGCSIDDDQYFAEIEHDRYRVIIFTTKQNSNVQLDTHDANSQVLFLWK